MIILFSLYIINEETEAQETCPRSCNLKGIKPQFKFIVVLFTIL